MCGIMGRYVAAKPVATCHAASSIDNYCLDIPANWARKNRTVRSLLPQFAEPGDIAKFALSGYVQMATGALKIGSRFNDTMRTQGHPFTSIR
jgi:hypothetical protein